MAQYQPKNFKPEHIHIVRLHWQGYSNTEIAQHLQLSETHVSVVINCDAAKQLLNELREHTIDGYAETQDDFQLVLPLIRREKIRLALESGDERIRNMACSDILAIAGHSPVRRLEITRGSAQQAIDKLTPEQLRDAILADIGAKLAEPETPAADESGPGPDDLLN